MSAEIVQAETRRAWRDPLSMVLAVVLCLPALVPLLVIAHATLSPEAEVWAHLSRYVLPEVTINTIKLLIGVALLSGVVGTALAWLTSICEFPGRRFFDWALLLPLAIPTYVLAFVAVGFLDFAGPLQSWLREVTGSSAWVPKIRSTGGVIFVLSLALYPYVYLLARTAFLTQGRRALEAAQMLGLGRAAATWKVALPMARPWIAAGIALVCMETLADFGAVSVFNYNTFTTAIYRAWFGMFSVSAALELAGVLLLFVIAAFALERSSRAGARFASSRDMTRQATRLNLGPVARWSAFVGAALVLALSFVLPLLQLLIWSVENVGDIDSRYWGFIARSLVLAGSAAVVIVLASLALAYIERRRSTRSMRMLVRLATLGYAIPGTVLAVGIAVPLVLLNNQLQTWLRAWMGESAPVLLLQGTLLAVLIAYLARFLTVGFNPVESGLQRVTRSIDEAAASLGVVGTDLIRKVHVPLLRTSLATAATLVFVDVMKEMPITLITRPPGWDTLAVRVWEMTSEGEWERAALPAVAIVLVGLIPAAMLTRRGAHVA
ncbi:binding-protein-dependent transport system inner membrane protein [Steroidobacter agaridevorans]|uniref:Binding-protein-dependent transport system inner membrane protein n=1 Tax=Steroidobacter agaridevorans TaxID=2695856 RepID=A0A829YMP3_9GAMM|nr:iron ABC transporter permease [Steroidobacter agaridevorans]GFE83978.1 binding-protein-dependent transport system inner membrane protein [Steroidobacter agaridevorans]